MRIEDLAAAADVAPSLVRYYEPGVLERLRRALIGRRLGISLAEIKAALADERPWAEVAAARLAAVDDEIRRLRVQRALLRHAARAGMPAPERYARVLAKIGA